MSFEENETIQVAVGPQGVVLLIGPDRITLQPANARQVIAYMEEAIKLHATKYAFKTPDGETLN